MMNPLPRMPMRKSFRRGRGGWMFRSISAYRNKRNPLPLVIASNSLRARIESEDPIHQKRVAMMTVLEFNAEQPGAIGHLFHRMCLGIPLVKIANEAHRVGLWRVADEIDRAQGFSVMVSKTHI